MAQWHKDLEGYMNELEIIDTHEHLAISNASRNQNTDIFWEYCTCYFDNDLMLSGMPKVKFDLLFDQSLSIMERWDIVEPYWEKCRFTGYGQVLDAAVRILYGIPAINRNTVEQVDRAIKDGLKQNHYRNVLKNVCHIKTALLDNYRSMDADKELFRPVCRIDPYIRFERYRYHETPDVYAGFKGLIGVYGKEIRSLNDLQDACEQDLYNMVKNGAIAFKTGLAYVRSLQYEQVTFAEAEKNFNCFLDEYTGKTDKTGGPWLALENYMMHYILTVIEKINLPLQIHTGLLGVSGNLVNTNPELLNNLFLQYPNVKFDIFHIGYPYQNVLGGLAKMFPNVYINMCWAHVISPPACIHSLGEWLETIPYNKILGFGGDYDCVDGVVGHRYLAIKNIAAVLDQKIQSGLFTKEQAFQIAKALLYDNPATLFGIT